MSMSLIACNLVIVSSYQCNNSPSLFVLQGPFRRTKFGGNPRLKLRSNKNGVVYVHSHVGTKTKLQSGVRLLRMPKETVLLVT